MCNAVYLINVAIMCFIWIHEEQLANLQEATTINHPTVDVPEAHSSNGTNYTMWQQEVITLSESFLLSREGQPVNLKKLMLEYSTVCPLQQSCYVDFEDRYLFTEDTRNIPAFSECKDCMCNRICVEYGNCCPGTHFGYVNQECINTVLYPKTLIHAFYMVVECHHNYIENNTVNELCESEILPCTSVLSRLVYKNKYCAQCNRDLCVEWKLNVVCLQDELFREMFSSISVMKTALNRSDCVVKYERPFYTDVVPFCHLNDYLKEVRINRCNVTGLWRQFDADIDWACENFIVPYKEFKNVFCYICNPSEGNVQNLPLVDKCEMHDSNSSLFPIAVACNDFPVSDRLKPFKNIYCYACNHGHDLVRSSGTGVSFLRDITEIIDKVTVSTQIYLSIVYPLESNVFDVRWFVQETVQESFEVKEISFNPQRLGVNKVKYNASSIDQIIDHYTTVCGQDNLCIDDVKTDRIYSNPVCGYCTCGSDCAENNECCPDTVLSNQPFSCLNTDIFPVLWKYASGKIWTSYEWLSRSKTYMLIDTCLNKTHELSHKCSSFNVTSDIFADIPISTHGTIAYRNIYCYTCNNNNTKDIILDLQAYCDTYIEYDLFTNLDQLIDAVKLYCHTVSFVPLKSKTCIEEYKALNASFISGIKYKRRKEHPSNFEFRVDEYVQIPIQNATFPVRDVYSSCNMTGYLTESNGLVNRICEDERENTLSLPEYRVENKVYKNFACFLCNPNFHIVDIDPDELISDCRLNSSVEWYKRNEKLEELCAATQRYDIWFPYKNMYCAECNLPPWQMIDIKVLSYGTGGPSYYKYLFSISPEDFAQIETASTEGNVPECPNGTYDFHLGLCRSLYCNTGYQLYNSTCNPVMETASSHIYQISLKVFLRDLDGSKENTVRKVMIDLNELCLLIRETISNTFGETINLFIQEYRCQSSSLCVTLHNATYTDIAHTEFINLFFDIVIEYTKTIVMVRKTFINALRRSYDLAELYDIDGNPHSIVLDTVQTNNLEWLRPGHSCVVGATYAFYPYVHSYYIVDRFLLCAYVKLNVSEVTIDQDTLVISVINTNVTFTESEYKLIDNHTIICIDDYNKKTMKATDKNPVQQPNDESNLLNIFTLVCTVISLVCLFLTFITYCSFSTLRNVPGKCIMLLCVSLFGSQAFLQFGLEGASKSILCLITGVFIHYFWMAFFCATHICSFHIYTIFCLNDMSNQSPSNEKKLFIKYLLYFLFCPLVVVVIAVLINVVRSDASTTGYGVNYCFISDFYILVATFLTPACLVFLSNYIFFSVAFHKIRSTPYVRSTRDRNNFYIFLKLCTIAGVTWPLLIIDNILAVYWFSFVVSGINSLQGVFVFGSFVLNKRVIRLYKEAFLKIPDKESVTAKVHVTMS